MVIFLCKTTILVRRSDFSISQFHAHISCLATCCLLHTGQPEITQTMMGGGGLGGGQEGGSGVGWGRIPSLLESSAIFRRCISTMLFFQFSVTTPALRKGSIIVTYFHNYINVELWQNRPFENIDSGNSVSAPQTSNSWQF